MFFEKKKITKVDKDTIIGDLLDAYPNTAPFFMAIGMNCLGCPVSRMENVEEACAVHGIDTDEMLDRLNAFIGN